MCLRLKEAVVEGRAGGGLGVSTGRWMYLPVLPWCVCEKSYVTDLCIGRTCSDLLE